MVPHPLRILTIPYHRQPILGHGSGSQEGVEATGQIVGSRWLILLVGCVRMSLQEVWVARGRQWDLTTLSWVNPEEVVLETALQLLKVTWRIIHAAFYILGVAR